MSQNECDRLLKVEIIQTENTRRISDNRALCESVVKMIKEEQKTRIKMIETESLRTKNIEDLLKKIFWLSVGALSVLIMTEIGITGFMKKILF